MQRVATGSLSGIQDLLDAEIAFARRRGTDGIGFVGHSDVKGGAVGFAEHSNARDVHLTAGSRDPDGDLAAVGDEDFSKHIQRGAVSR